MKAFSSTPQVFLEFGLTSVQVLDQDRGIELPIERLDNGRLAPASKEKLILELQGFLHHSRSWPRRRALCALSARGVSMRRFTIPPAEGEERQRLLALQMEAEFPLPPDALAWGYCPIPAQSGSPRGPGQEVLVAALKRELLEDDSAVLESCGLIPVFTLAAFARSVLCPASAGAYAALEIGQHHSELLTLEHGILKSARVVPWGSENLTRALAAEPVSSAALAPRDAPMTSEVEPLAGLLQPKQLGAKLYLFGPLAQSSSFRSALSAVLRLPCEQIELPSAPGRSATTLGLQRLCSQHGAVLPLVFQSSVGQQSGSRPQWTPWRWAVAAGLLLCLALGLCYGEAFVRKPALAKRLAAIKSQQGGLAKIDREFAFLQYYQTNQPPLMEALLLVANAAPGGTRLDSVSLSRRGDLSVRGTMANPQQTGDFRSKLIDSGFFDNVALDEQTPSADRQKTTFRLSAQLKSEGERPSLPLATLAKPRPGDKPPVGVALSGTPPPNVPPVGAAPGAMRVPPEPGTRSVVTPP